MKQVFINLAVKDLNQSMDFYTALGFSNNPQFSDDTAKCMVWSEQIFVMLLTHDKFKTFTTKPLADTKHTISGLFYLSMENLEQLNLVMAKGLAAGGIEPTEIRDYGFMQQRTIEDFDGHTWELGYMDASQFPQQ